MKLLRVVLHVGKVMLASGCTIALSLLTRRRCLSLWETFSQFGCRHLSSAGFELGSASDRAYCIYETLHECENFLSRHDPTTRKNSIPPPDTLNIIDKFHDVFVASMSDDLHTPVVLAALSDPLKAINDLLHARKISQFTQDKLDPLVLYSIFSEKTIP
ncbi:hypothetical protein L6164_024342 [Bauhinia variegata]|uniref:Uncharacterized protein n=1 Tax=Bauhinia variegata TaxID=167791 RepID=A0ACB9LYR9_BAUVA|nr:hypothetical protein L6164_024342 [Bauhinia variegata]